MSEYINRFRPSQAEIDRRYANTRMAMEQAGLDALIISGSEYSGFEGAVRYMCGFLVLHRYAYVVIPLEGEPCVCFRARQPGSAITAPRLSNAGSFPPIVVNGWLAS